MKFLLVVIFLGLSGISQAQEKDYKNSYYVDIVNFAERNVMIQFVESLSPSVRLEIEKCKFGCDSGTSALFMGIDMLGVVDNKDSRLALINLLGLRLDAGLAERRSCQILIHGNSLLNLMEQMEPKQVSSHCQSQYKKLKKHEISYIRDVSLDQVCHSESDILNMKKKYIEAIKSNTMCDW